MVKEGISAKVDISQTSEKVTRSVVWLFGGGGSIPERKQSCKDPDIGYLACYRKRKTCVITTLYARGMQNKGA